MFFFFLKNAVLKMMKRKKKMIKKKRMMKKMLTETCLESLRRKLVVRIEWEMGKIVSLVTVFVYEFVCLNFPRKLSQLRKFVCGNLFAEFCVVVF